VAHVNERATARDQAAPAGPTWRLALASGVALLVVVGLEARLPAPHWRVAIGPRDTATAGTLLVIDLALAGWLVVRARRSPAVTVVVSRLRTVLRYVLTLGAVGLGAATLLASGALDVHWQQSTGLGARGSVTPTRPPKVRISGGGNSGSVPVPSLALALAAGALVLVATMVAVRAARSRPAPEPAGRREPARDYSAVLEEAVVGGRHALLALDDARAAIVACYQAMERALADTGTSRAPAETPDELLARAAVNLVSCEGAAHRLTWLFYEARFSSHQLGPGERNAAEAALTELAYALASGPALASASGPAPA
jgi:Domain of unknown function (DUF4129)